MIALAVRQFSDRDETQRGRGMTEEFEKGEKEAKSFLICGLEIFKFHNVLRTNYKRFPLFQEYTIERARRNH